MRLSRPAALAVTLALGCTDYVPGAAEDLSVVPSSGSTTQETAIEIRGQLVVARVRVDYSEPEAAEALARVRVWMRTASSMEVGRELEPVRLTDEKHLQTVVPAGLPPGLYDVVVQDAYERERVVAKAFTVIGVECSDGLTRGEPCGESCTRIVGCECRAEDQCTGICGDGLLRGDQRCDDGNTAPGDGCDGACGVEPGYTCAGEPSVCHTTCGDGVVAGQEACDDGNEATGDGCTPDCQVEDGWTCNPNRCVPVCGDGVILGQEVCDPGLQRVGCGQDCQPLRGFECGPSNELPDRIVCRPRCGDGIILEDEGCDDGNIRPGDGCFLCKWEEGWTCQDEPSVCHTVCGDGTVKGEEACDPGPDNEDPSDLSRACGPDCQAAPGYECEDGMCSAIPCTIGDACDDGNVCTRDDVCSGEQLCRGTPEPSCLNYCSLSCVFDLISGRTNCCEDTCAPTGECPDCGDANSVAEPMCSYTCQFAECRARCRGGSTCSLDYVPAATVLAGGRGRLECDSGAVCAMSCDGTRIVVGAEPTCVLDCEQGAICLLEGCVEAQCALNCQDQSLLECDTARGRVLVCGRDCPE